MSYLFHIEVSPRGEESISGKLATQFIESFKESHPDVPIKTKNLSTDAPPHLGLDGIYAGYVPVENRTESQIAAFKIRQDVIDELSGFVYFTKI